MPAALASRLLHAVEIFLFTINILLSSVVLFSYRAVTSKWCGFCSLSGVGPTFNEPRPRDTNIGPSNASLFFLEVHIHKMKQRWIKTDLTAKKLSCVYVPTLSMSIIE